MFNPKVVSSGGEHLYQVPNQADGPSMNEVLSAQFAIDLIGDFPSCQSSLRCLNLKPLEKRFKSILDQLPGLPRAKIILGTILFFQHWALEGEQKTQKLREAGDRLFEVLKGGSIDYNASYLLANVCQQLRRCVETKEAQYLKDLAKGHLSVVLQMKPTCESEWIIFRKAVTEYGELMNNEDNMSQSDSNVHSGDLKSTLDCQYSELTETVENNPTDLQAQYSLGRICLKYRHHLTDLEYAEYAAQAATCFQTVIKTVPLSCNNYCLIGNALYQYSKLLSGEAKETQLVGTKEVLESFLSKQPDEPFLWLTLAKTYLAFRNYCGDEAQAMYLENQSFKCFAKIFQLETSI